MLKQTRNALGLAIWGGAALSLAAVSAHAQDAETAAAPQSVVMVLDGSGSMWGQIDGAPKIEIARTVIGGLLDTWNENVELGVIAYGHREKGQCTDIETLVEVGPVDKNAVMSKVNAINPKGKTPISAAVRQAAETLKYKEEKATVILVSDGLETCNADPCALANELEAAGVDFTTHVIGFDITEEEKAGLACLANNTGGRFMSAQSAGELTTALAETVEIVTETASVPEPEVEIAAGPQGIKLAAKLCEDCDLLNDNIFWWINEPTTDIEGNRKEVSRMGRAQGVMELPAGEYQVVARYGVAYANADVTVEPGKLTDFVMTMNAGNLRINAAATEGGQILDNNMFYWAFETKTDLEGNRKEVTRMGSANGIMRMPAGDYLIRARHGSAYADEVVTVNAGELTDLTFDMNVGYLRVNAAMNEGGAEIPKDMFYWVLEDKTDLEGNRKEITRAGAHKHIFRLTAGDYLLRARHGVAYVDTPFSVEAGSLQDMTVVMNSARIKLSAVQTAGGPALDNGVFWWVYQPTGDLEGTEREITRAGAASPLLTLPAGEFILAVRYGGAITRTPISLSAGDEKPVEVVLNP